MVLLMARPFRHPTTGIFWYRRRVPDALRSIVGKREHKESLRTRDPAEARIAHARVSAEIDERWIRLRAGAQSLSHRQAEAIAGDIYRSMIADHGDNPQRASVTSLLLDKAFVTSSAKIVAAGADAMATAALIDRLRNTRNAKRIDAWLSARGWILTPDSRELVEKAVAKAVLQARQQLHRMRGGDYRPDPDGDRFPPLETGRKLSKDKYSLLRVFDDYAVESQLAPATVKKWRPIIRQVAAEVPDIRNLTRDWCLTWKDQLIARNLAPRSIRETYVASLRAMCEWAVNNSRISENPALRIKIKTPKRASKRGYTDSEAAKILRASLQPVSARISPKTRAARRWIPTLCAYTGARVGEIAQLRKQDIRKTDGVWLIRITPEAGTVKGDLARDVAIHPEILRQGFIDFVDRSSGPLFYTSTSPRGGSAGNPTSKKPAERIARWIRHEVGITDERISPNHAWRHRFKTVARRVKMDSGARDYMQGHAVGSEGENYGEFEPIVLFAEISKIPAIDLKMGSPERG